MSTENSSSKWLVGCLIAGVVGMLLCGGGVMLVVVWGYRAAQQVAQQIGPEFQKQMQSMQFAAEWRPPAPEAGPEELFPEQFGAWTRGSHDDQAAIPELAIARDGFHGTYEANGTTVNVYAYPLPVTEQGQLFGEAVKAIDSAGYSTRSQANGDMGSYHWMTFSFDPPQRFGRMWWASEWLVVTMTDNPAVNLENFEQGYLLAIQGPPIPGMDETQPTPIDPTTAEPTDTANPSTSLPVEPDDASAPAEPQPSEPSAQETPPADPDTAPAEPSSNESAPDDAETASGSDGQ